MKNPAKHTRRPEFIFSVLRVATVLAGLLGTGLAALLLYIGIRAASLFFRSPADTSWWSMSLIGLATVTAVSVCCYMALISFYRLCGRLREGSAFILQNGQAMQRISLLMALCGAALFLSSVAAFALVGFDLRILLVLGLPCCVFFGTALIAWALSLLVNRAIILQQESELTI